MKKSILCLTLGLLSLTMPLHAQKSEGESILRAALKGWHVKLRAGFLLGGTTPLPLPQEIRSIDSYNPTMNIAIEGGAQKMFEPTKWGMALGVRLETKGMKTDATVKNYHMEMTADDGGYMVGAWTGHVKTNVRATYLTFPILAVYKVAPRWELRGGPYLSWMYDGNFSGEAEKDFFGRSLAPFEAVTRKAVVPSDEELARNPRSRSAKLRAAVKR